MLSALHRRLNGRGVQVVGIAADEHDKVAAYSATAPVSYPLLVAGKEAIRVTVPFGNVPQGVPFTLVFDQTGNVRAAILGAAHEEALEQLLATLI